MLFVCLMKQMFVKINHHRLINNVTCSLEQSLSKIIKAGLSACCLVTKNIRIKALNFGFVIIRNQNQFQKNENFDSFAYYGLWQGDAY